ncbi:MAG: hypothetical protein EBQ72_05240, partial [Actinobacteria bacterium]|nr:hypothetical protein [Actinomycetota bacterium]
TDGTGTTTGTGTDGTGTTTGTGTVLDNNQSPVKAVQINVAPQGSKVVWPALAVILVIIGPSLAVTAYRKVTSRSAR